MQFENSPVYSLAGDFVVFVREDANGRGDLWVVDVAASVERSLTQTEEFDDYLPRFSEDGSTIYFLRIIPGDWRHSRRASTWMIKLDGTGLEQLHDEPVAVAPSGDRFLFTRRDHKTGRTQIWEQRFSSSDARPVGYGVNPVYSRNGTLIVALSENSDRELSVIETEPKMTSRRIQVAKGYKHHLSISPDNRYVIMHIDTQHNQGVGHIYLVDLGTGQSEIVVDAL